MIKNNYVEKQPVGIVIGHFRKKQNVGQLELCDGICSVTTLSRMEAGKCDIDSLTAEVLLGRLGKSPDRMELLLDDYDYKLWEIREKIENSADHSENMKEMALLLKKYKKIMPLNENVHMQFYLYYSAKMEMLQNKPKEQIIKRLKKAIRLTKPDYDRSEKNNKKNNILYSSIEIRIIYQLIQFQNLERTLEKNRRQLEYMIRFTEEFYDEEQKEKIYIPMIYQLAVMKKKEKKFIEAIEWADKGIDIIANGRKYIYLAELHFLKAEIIEEAYHNRKEWEYQKSICLEECLCAYYIYQFDENRKEAEKVEDFVRGRLKCQITM